MGFLEWLKQLGTDPRDKSAALGDRIEALERRRAALGGELETLDRRVAEGVAAGEEVEELRAERRLRREELEDVERALELLHEKREALAAEVLERNLEEAAREARRRLRSAAAASDRLARAVFGVVNGELEEFEEEYSALRDWTRRAHRLRERLANEHGRELEVEIPSSVDRRTAAASPEGHRAREALREFVASLEGGAASAWPSPADVAERERRERHAAG